MSVGGPQRLFQLLPRNYFSLLLQQHDEDLIDLALQADSRAAAGHLLTMLVNAKRTKTHITRLD